MKALTKTLVAASLAFSTAGANAAIVNDKTFAAEAFLSVYDSVHQGTFTLDLGVTLGTLVSNINDSAYSLSFDLSSLSDWSSFKTGAGSNLSTSKYLVTAGGAQNFVPTFVATGNSPIVSGVDFSSLDNGVNNISQHALEINTDAAVNGVVANDTTYVVVGQGGIGHHGDAGTLWQTPVNHDPQAVYGNAVDFWMTDIQDFTSSQVSQFAGQWKLDGDTLTYGAVSAVPVPAAVWLFGSAMLGMLGISRRKMAA